jgi:hypothetical protein
MEATKNDMTLKYMMKLSNKIKMHQCTLIVHDNKIFIYVKKFKKIIQC